MDDLERLFRAEYARLVRALSVACGDPERAADAVQDAFVQASRHWRSVESYDDPARWLRRVALNRLANHHRSHRRRQARVARAAAEPVEPLGQPDAALLDLRDALAGLPDGQRMAICLHYLADAPVAEVADLLSVSVGTVKSQLADGRKNLAKQLGVPDGS